MNRVAAGVGTLGTKSQYSVGPQNHEVFLKCLWSQQNVQFEKKRHRTIEKQSVW